MSIPGAGNPLLLGGAAGGGYEIERSLRFNLADSAYLSRTPASTGNRKTWTWSGWVKRGDLANRGAFFAACNAGATVYTLGEFDAAGHIRVLDSGVITGSDQGARTTTALFRDPAAWYHIVLVYDTPNATDADRIRIYVNGSRITNFSEERSVTQNLDSQVNLNTMPHTISRYGDYAARYHDGYLADIHFIDGQALTPSSFGEFDTNGIWQPKAYTGTYGTNGFHLPFSDNSAATATTLGKDTSGNGNNWTPNNLSVTAGAGNDSLVDSPTNYGTDTGAGGEVRGSYCTWNPLDKYTDVALANGNLDFSQSNAGFAKGTIGVSSGKWYWEIHAAANNNCPGLSIPSVTPSATYLGGVAGTCGINQSSGLVFAQAPFSTANGNTQIGTYSNCIVGCALDCDNGTFKLYIDGVLRTANHIVFTPGITVMPGLGTNVSTSAYPTNFGQRVWAYPAPAGHKALCTTNLPTPTIADGSTVMDVVTYTGNGSTQTISGLGFSPDLVWIKMRNGALSHVLSDTVRGANTGLFSDLTNAEGTGNYVTAFNSDGFSLGNAGATNASTYTYAAWTWDAGSSTVTNTDGTISSQVRANASAGFSVLTYTGATASSTIGHGLGVAPSLIISKSRGGAGQWVIYHAALGFNYYGGFNTAAFVNNSAAWKTSPTSSVYTIGSAAEAPILNTTGETYVSYCFAPVAGYSAYGSYTGNGNADGPFVYTGFRPRWIMLKSSSAAYDWVILDTERDLVNAVANYLRPNLSAAEGNVGGLVDFCSNGFKQRNTYGNYNASGATYIYAAFAENPFKTSRGR